MPEKKAASTFIAKFFGPTTSGPVFVCSLPNDKGGSEPGEKRVMTRNAQEIDGHVGRWDRQGRGLFFCVNPLKLDAQPDRDGGSPRNKANVLELCANHVDSDAKSIVGTLDDVRREARQLRCPPSVVNFSGHGLHLFWLFRESIEANEFNIARIERINGQLADLLGGDLVGDVTRLMRLPGTHNTKNGEHIEVVTEVGDFERRYEIEEIEEMLAEMSPRIKRKPVERRGSVGQPRVAYENAYLAFAESIGFKPPIDVKDRLASMSYQGVGDSSVHSTQLQVSAALLSKGESVPRVVAALVEATRAAVGEFGDRWNWTREEQAIRRMCEDFLRKHPEAAARHEHHEEAAMEDEKVVGIDSRARKNGTSKANAAPRPAAGDKLATHIALGMAVIKIMSDRGERLLVNAGQIWRYSDGIWSTPLLDGRQWLDVEIEKACRGMSVVSTIKLVSETRNWLLRNPDIHDDDIEWDAHDLIPTQSGLVDPRTFEITPPAPEHYSTWRIECRFNPEATCPWWWRMLEDFFADRAEEARSATITVLQEAYGCTLIDKKPRALTRGLVFHGGSESGKSQVIDVLGGLTSDRPISTPLDSLDGTHGTMEFLRRAPWILHEAFDQAKWLFSSKVKQILSGDPIQINAKNAALVTRRVKAPVLWGTNHPPSFKESTAAIVNRLIIFRSRQTFSRDKPVGAAAEAQRRGLSEPRDLILGHEKEGLLLWAMRGAQRALQRGYLLSTPELDEALQEVSSDSNMVSGFLDECVTWDRDARVSVPDFCAAFAVWWVENKGDNRFSPSNDAIGRAMTSYSDPRLGADPRELRDNQRRYYVGFHLNQIGMDYWHAASTNAAASGKTTRISTKDSEVNGRIPVAWDNKSVVRKVRNAFAAMAVTLEVTLGDFEEKEVSPEKKCHRLSGDTEF